jgi:hypothetical protein
MAKKRNLKLTKKQKKRFQSLVRPIVIGFGGFIFGIVLMILLQSDSAPQNIVWAADDSVKVPGDLRAYLESRDDCKEYKGTGTPTGVGLWGVYQVADNRFAKIAYGCSWGLSSYIMAVKQKTGWELLKPTEYFAPFKDGINPAQGALPYCAMLEKHKIPSHIESFCITADGTAQSNPNN